LHALAENTFGKTHLRLDEKSKGIERADQMASKSIGHEREERLEEMDE